MVIKITPSHAFPLAAGFFNPLPGLPVPPHLSRTCHGIGDTGWLLIGAARVRGNDATGRAFPEAHDCPITRTPARSSFFDALASPRRLHHLRTINEALARLMTRTTEDPFAIIGELDAYDLPGGDGHWHAAAAAAHDRRDAKGTKHATGHVYLINQPPHPGHPPTGSL